MDGTEPTQAQLPDFRGVDAEDLLGLALGELRESEISRDMVPPGAGAVGSTIVADGQPAGHAHVTSQQLDSEIRRLQVGFTPQSGSEAQLVGSEPQTELAAGSFRPAGTAASGAAGHGDSPATRQVPADGSEAQIGSNGSQNDDRPWRALLQQTQPFSQQQDSQAWASQGDGMSFEGAGDGPAGTLDTAELDRQLNALPVGTEDQGQYGVEQGALDPGAAPASEQEGYEGNEAHGVVAGSEAADWAPQSADMADGGAAAALAPSQSAWYGEASYVDSQAMAVDEAIRALHVGTEEDPDLRPPSGSADGDRAGAAATASNLSADAVATEAPAPTPAAAAQAAASARTDPPTVLQAPPPQARGGFGGGGGGGWDDGGFEDDLEDYLAAQASDAAAAAAAPPQPRQPALDYDYDELMAELEYGGAAPLQAPPQAASAAAGPSGGGLRSTGAILTGPRAPGAAPLVRSNGGAAGSRSQETVQQQRGQPLPPPKRARTAEVARGRPTMEELFGSDDEAEGAVAAAAAAGERRDARGAAQAAGRARDDEEVEDAEAEEAAKRPVCFPPQRLACNVTGGAAVPVTAASGERVYCRVEEPVVGTGVQPQQHAAAAAARRGQRGGRRGGNLLQQPLSDMLRMLEERQLRAAVAASEREERERARRLHAAHHHHHPSPHHAQQDFTAEERAFAGMPPEGWEDDDGAAAAAAAPPGRRRRTSGVAGHGGDAPSSHQLWVDKYAPRNFMSLLSDERTNRQVALWVKDWDECVFGRGGPGASGGAARSKADTRPQHKVLLIGGAPGLGKTTLAHVVARHCGYHPYEINASDDRTAATLATKIADAVQMTAVLGGGRPNCVIVDEVDGATGGTETGGAVAALLKLVKAGEGGAGAGGKSGGGRGGGDDDNDGAASGSDGEDGGRRAGAKRRAGAAGGGRRAPRVRPLARPIICICNDLYAPALRPLRDVARVFHFSPPTTERLVARLSQICQAERLDADPAALRLLVERTERDVRAAINSLQFLARRAGAAGADGAGRRLIEVKDIESLHIASKDTTQSAMDLWGALLSTGGNGVAARRRAAFRHAGGGGASGGELGELCNRLMDFGDYDLVLSGLHENLPRVRFMDVNLSRTAAAAEAMGTADILLRTCRRTGDFSALRFVPPCLATVRALVAQSERPRQLTWPRVPAEAARRASAAAQLVRSWASGGGGGSMAGGGGGGADPSVLSAHGAHAMMLELAPALRALVSQPAVRAVVPTMMSAEETAALSRTAGLMLHYGLRYCFESPPPPGLQPLTLPEAVAPVSNNAIILGLTAEVQQNISAAAGGATGAGTSGGWQRQQQQQPWGGAAGRGGRGGGRAPYNSYGQGRGGGGGPGAAGGGGAGRGFSGAGGAAAPPPPQAAAAAAAAARLVPLLPPIDTLHCFTAFAGGASAPARTVVPLVVRQMISQQTEVESIRRTEAARIAAISGGAPALAQPVSPVHANRPAGAAAAGGNGDGPLRPVAAPPQRQMAGRMPPPAEGKKPGGAAAGVKRKGTWMDAFKQAASAKARAGAGGAATAGAAARKADEQGAEEGPAPAPAARSNGKLPFPVLYRFNEGYTNAVKRPLLMRELL